MSKNAYIWKKTCIFDLTITTIAAAPWAQLKDNFSNIAVSHDEEQSGLVIALLSVVANLH